MTTELFYNCAAETKSSVASTNIPQRPHVALNRTTSHPKHSTSALSIIAVTPPLPWADWTATGRWRDNPANRVALPPVNRAHILDALSVTCVLLLFIEAWGCWVEQGRMTRRRKLVRRGRDRKRKRKTAAVGLDDVHESRSNGLSERGRQEQSFL